jgi:multiple sugar transport system permease protein
MVLFLAGLQQIPKELYEAAALDHASRWTTFRRITLPSLRRTILLVLVIEIILQFQVFGQVLLMTRGGPANTTRVLVQYVYETSFRDWQVGYAAAMSMLLFAVMAIASLAQLRLSRPED